MDRGQMEAKGRILVDALVMCIARSKVRDVVDPETIRSVIGSALGELWREGEFRLEAVWKILCQQPGLAAPQVAPPLFVFKAHEEQLGVAVRLPEALASVPRSEQARLRDSLGVKDDEFAQYLRELADLAASEQARQTLADAGAKAAAPGQSAADLTRAAHAARATRKRRATLAALLAAIAVAALGGSLYLSLRPTAVAFDTADVAGLLRIEGGQRAGDGLTARITDVRWDKLSKDERKRLVGDVFERERAKGLNNLTLTDGTGRVRALVTSPPSGRDITLF